MKMFATLAAVTVMLAASAAAQQGYGPLPGNGRPYQDPQPGYGQAPYGQPGYGPDYRGRPQAEFFVDDDFRGRSIMLDHPVRRLGPTGMEDKISSIGIRSGVWLVCADDDFRGRCVRVDHSIARLSEIGMDDKISSIRPLRPRELGGY